MTQPVLMEKSLRDFILAGEIATYLHDLGKAHPGFLLEMTKHEHSIEKTKGESAYIGEPHGAILEPEAILADTKKGEGQYYLRQKDRTFSHEIQQFLERLRSDQAWQALLQHPLIKEAYQTKGLGDPLRIHHAFKPPSDEPDFFSFLGDVVAFGADTRDSAMDKGSGKVKDSNQSLDSAFLADGFGFHQQVVDEAQMLENWQKLIKRLNEILFPEADKLKSFSVEKVRRQLYTDETIQAVFLQTLAETRRPTNDVTLHHHAYAVASLTKGLLAEFCLCQDASLWNANREDIYSQLGYLRQRLLTISWDWERLIAGALTPMRLYALASLRNEMIKQLQDFIEVKYPIGNLLLEDSGQVTFVVPAFYKGASKEQEAESEQLFEKHVISVLVKEVEKALSVISPGFSAKLSWSAPQLYLMGLTEVSRFEWVAGNPRQKLVQATQGWHEKWQKGMAPCPQCGLNPVAMHEKSLFEAGLTKVGYGYTDLCGSCNYQVERYRSERWEALNKLYGFIPRSFKLNDYVSPENPRLALIEVFFESEIITTGGFLLTQRARPFEKMELNKKFAQSRQAAKEKIQQFLDNKDRKNLLNPIHTLVGDDYWWKHEKGKYDGRIPKADIQDGQDAVVALAEQFFGRELQEWVARFGLAESLSERVLLFAERKHASLGRLQRTWRALSEFLRQIVVQLHGLGIQVLPFNHSFHSVQFVVPAEKMDEALRCIQHRSDRHFQKMDFALAPQVSVAVFKNKFPLYMAFDALDRMRNRVHKEHYEIWTLKSKIPSPDNQAWTLCWQTPSGECVERTVPIHFNDHSQNKDFYHSHYILASQAVSPIERLRSIADLQEGDEVYMYPRTVDVVVLDTSRRRFDLDYQPLAEYQGVVRHHWVMGERKHRPFLLENVDQMTDFVYFLKSEGWDSTRRKQIFGVLVEQYENWVREAPEPLKEKGFEAYLSMGLAIFQRYLSRDVFESEKEKIQQLLESGRIFDAFDWAEFIGKSEGGNTDEKL